MKILFVLLSISLIHCINFTIDRNGIINFTNNQELNKKNLTISLFIQGILLKNDNTLNKTKKSTLTFDTFTNITVYESNYTINIKGQNQNWIVFYSNNINKSYFGLGRWNDNSNIKGDGRIIKQLSSKINHQLFAFHFENNSTTLILNETFDNFTTLCDFEKFNLNLWGCNFSKIYKGDFNQIKNSNRTMQKKYYKNNIIEENVELIFSFEGENQIYLSNNLKKELKNNITNITLSNGYNLIHLPELKCTDNHHNKTRIIINKETLKKFVYVIFNEEDDKILFDKSSNLFLDIYEFTDEHDITIKFLIIEFVLIILILIGVMFFIYKNKENFGNKQFSLNESFE